VERQALPRARRVATRARCNAFSKVIRLLPKSVGARQTQMREATRVASKSGKNRLCRLMCGKPPAFRRRPPPFPSRLGWKAEPTSRAEMVRLEALGKAKPFRTSGGRAPLGCYLSATLTRPW
jgi:hypothetical protein